MIRITIDSAVEIRVHSIASISVIVAVAVSIDIWYVQQCCVCVSFWLLSLLLFSLLS